ncbi:MAG: S-layer protein, partial [Barnesiella sp.]
MRKTLTLILSLLVTGILMAQPKQEIRAVWLTTNPNAVDWPKSTKEAEQKASLIEILDKLQAANFNT